LCQQYEKEKEKEKEKKTNDDLKCKTGEKYPILAPRKCSDPLSISPCCTAVPQGRTLVSIKPLGTTG
jgi:hypothetical protein